MKSSISQIVIAGVCAIVAFGFGKYIGEVIVEYKYFEKRFATNQTIKAQVLRVAVKDGQVIAKEDLEPQSLTKGWAPFDSVTKADQAIGKKVKADLPAGHVVAEHDLFID